MYLSGNYQCSIHSSWSTGIHPSIHLLSIYFFLCLSIYLSIYLSCIYFLFIYPSIHRYSQPTISTCLSMSDDCLILCLLVRFVLNKWEFFFHKSTKFWAQNWGFARKSKFKAGSMPFVVMGEKICAYSRRKVLNIGFRLFADNFLLWHTKSLTKTSFII